MAKIAQALRAAKSLDAARQAYAELAERVTALEAEVEQLKAAPQRGRQSSK